MTKEGTGHNNDKQQDNGTTTKVFNKTKKSKEEKTKQKLE